jgi:hypothetical protein
LENFSGDESNLNNSFDSIMEEDDVTHQPSSEALRPEESTHSHTHSCDKESDLLKEVEDLKQQLKDKVNIIAV